MRWKTRVQENLAYQSPWESWFAYRPVIINNETVWLEFVERCYIIEKVWSGAAMYIEGKVYHYQSIKK